MANYLTTDDVQSRLRQNFAALYTPRGWSAEDEAIVEADIQAAEADLHSYLAGRYIVPVTDAEAVKLLKHWSLILLQEIAYGAIPGRELPKNIAAQVDSLRERLQHIADGKLSLGTAATVPAAETGMAAAAEVAGQDAVFSRDLLKGF
jgi:phage gp36-like protein